MPHARFMRRVCGVILAGWTAGSAGCTHHHYYGNAVPVCGPTTSLPATTTTDGAVCEVPVRVRGPGLLGLGHGRSTIVSGAPYYSEGQAPRVVVSEPRRGWQRVDPEASLARTEVQGGIDEPTTTK